MPFLINPDNPKNSKFLGYVVEELKSAEEVNGYVFKDITIQEGITPFPVFEKTKPSENIDIATDEAMADASKHRDLWAESIFTFLHGYFKDIAELRLVQRIQEKPLTFKFTMASNNRRGIFRMAEELSLKKASHSITKNQDENVGPVGDSEIYYNSETGKGFVNAKPFTFKSKSKEFKVFAEMYKRINYSIKREKVLELAGYPKRKDGSYDPFKQLKDSGKRDTTDTTYFINEIAKKMRDTTGLSPYYVSNNDGNLTLVGNKLKDLPQQRPRPPK